MNSRVRIDEDKCVGCGICAGTCHQGVIEIIDGKAKVINDEQCDNLGRCLPVCPMGAITLLDANGEVQKVEETVSGCPGKISKTIEREVAVQSQERCMEVQTHLNQWPVQIQLVHPSAPYFNNAHLLVAADCTAYAYGNFHQEFMKNKVTIIGCPKLDTEEYSEKLTQILKDNEIKSVTITRMEVPCCGGLEMAVRNALRDCGKLIPWQVVTISTDGKILED